jgi:hypothetical protein
MQATARLLEKKKTFYGHYTPKLETHFISTRTKNVMLIIFIIINKT